MDGRETPAGVKGHRQRNSLCHWTKKPIEFMKWMGRMQRLIHVKLRDILFFRKNGALASTLIRMSNSFGKVEGGQIIITEKFTNADIGCLIGATRETVNRMIPS